MGAISRLAADFEARDTAVSQSVQTIQATHETRQQAQQALQNSRVAADALAQTNQQVDVHLEALRRRREDS